MSKNGANGMSRAFDKPSRDETPVNLEMPIGDACLVLMLVLREITATKRDAPEVKALMQLLGRFAFPIVDHYPDTENFIGEIVYKAQGVIVVFEK